MTDIDTPASATATTPAIMPAIMPATTPAIMPATVPATTPATTTSPETTVFDRTTAVVLEGVGEHRFRAEFDPSWASLRGVHGGYQTAVAVRAAQAIAPGRVVRTVSAAFLRPAHPGPAVVDIEVLRSTRNFTTTVATISQDGRAVTSVRVTSVEPVVGHEWSTPVIDRPAPLSESVAFTPPPQILHFAQATLLIDRNTIPSSDGAVARVAGHVRPTEGGRLDAPWLVMIGDWFPPSPFRRVEIPIGGVSVEYTVHLHRTVQLASDEWLEGVFETDNSSAGLALEHGTLSTGDGSPVAETFHTRWTG